MTLRMLPTNELLDVLSTPDPREFIVGGMVDGLTGTLTVYRGDFSRLTVPLSIFQPTGTGNEIDPSDFEVIDNGFTKATPSIGRDTGENCEPRRPSRIRAASKKGRGEDATPLRRGESRSLSRSGA